MDVNAAKRLIGTKRKKRISVNELPTSYDDLAVVYGVPHKPPVSPISTSTFLFDCIG